MREYVLSLAAVCAIKMCMFLFVGVVNMTLIQNCLTLVLGLVLPFVSFFFFLLPTKYIILRNESFSCVSFYQIGLYMISGRRQSLGLGLFIVFHTSSKGILCHLRFDTRRCWKLDILFVFYLYRFLGIE